MKRYIYRYIFILATLVLAASCAEKLTDGEILDGRDRVKIDVTYSLAGSEVKAVALSHNSVKKVLEVNVNSEGLKWNLESNRDWCVVVPEEHCGPGTVTLDIAANESFEEREPATLTFVAGDYRGFQITVTQNASSFIIGQPYYVAGKAGDSYVVNVTTLLGADWECSSDSWMEVTKGTPVSDEEYTTTPVTIAVEANDGDTRYGSVTLSDGSASDKVWIHQFGSELQYDDQGNIFLQGDDQASLTLTVPSFSVSDVMMPDYAKSSVVENGDGTATLTFALESNLSDCGEPRQVDISLLLSNASSSIVTLPSMVQDYIPANGLVTPTGLLAFAKAVAEGKPTTDWEEDGVVTVKKDIDMKDVTGWPGVGTAEAPFTGKFDGNGHAVTNLDSSVGLFGYCQDASVSNIILGKGSNLYYDEEFSGLAGSFGGIAAVAKSTSVTGCEVIANMEYAGSNDNDEPAYVGGLVGYVDEKSTVTKSRMTGNLTISTGTSEMVCYVGGFAGYSDGTVTNNEMAGKITFTSGISNIVAGGVTSAVPAGAVVSNNSFMGTLTLGGTSKYVSLGGLYGTVKGNRTFDSTSDKSVTLGSIDINSYLNNAASEIYAGGFVGKVEEETAVSFNGYECQTNFYLNQKGALKSAYVCIGGVLGGTEHDAANISASFENLSNSGEFTTEYDENAVSYISKGFVGGIAGYVFGNATFKKCVNNGELGKLLGSARYNARANGYFMQLGGIAGGVMNGNAEFANCENKADITNKFYSNHFLPDNSSGGWYTACTAAGILGVFDYKTTAGTGTLTISGCSNTGHLVSFRGTAAGIVGFARNATITSCTNLGPVTQKNDANNAPVKAGIAGCLSNSTIQECVAKCGVYAAKPGASNQRAGGLLSIVLGENVVISNSSYHGAITIAADGAPYCGGLVSVGKEDTVIKDCKFGGTVNGITISANNVQDNAVGNGLGQLSNITLWDGNL